MNIIDKASETVNSTIDKTTNAIGKAGETVEKATQTIDKVGTTFATMVKVVEGFNPVNMGRLIKRVILWGGLAMAGYAIAKSLASVFMVNRICRTLEIVIPMIIK